MGVSTEKELLIKVRADVRAATADLKKLAKDIKADGVAAKQANKNINNMGKSVSQLRTVVGAYLSLSLAKNIINQADAWNVLQVRIRTATKDTGDYNKVSNELYAINQRNGAQMETTVSLFQNLARTAPELNATNDEILKLTNSVQQLGVISGATQASQSAGLLQFSQGLAGGVFRAEEFNSIIENIPEVAQRIAKGMGLTVGSLRAAVLEGEVLSKDVFDSLLKQTDDISREFEAIPDSVARAGASVSNSFSRFLSQLDQAATGTSNLAVLMRLVTQSLDNWTDSFTQTELDSILDERAKKVDKINLLNKIGFQENTNGYKRLLAEIDELDKKIISINKKQLDSGLVPIAIDDKKKSPDGDSKESKKDKSLRERIDRNIESLQLEAFAFGATSKEIELYKLQLKGANDEQLARAAVLLTTIESEAEFEAAVKASEQSVKDENEAYQDWLKTLKEDGLKVLADTRTEQEKLSIELQKMDKLLEAGAISWDTYARAVFDAQEAVEGIGKAGESTMEELIAATKGWGDAFTETLTDMVIEGKANFSDLAKAIIRDILKILIYQNLIKPVLSSFSTEGSSEGFADGGMVSGPGSATSDSIPARLSDGEFVQPARAVRHYGAGFMESLRRLQVPRFAGGGMVTSVRRPAVARFAEGGLVDSQAQGAGNVRVEIENKGQPAKVESSRANVDVNGIVVSVVLGDLDSDGPIAHKVSRTFGLKRSS